MLQTHRAAQLGSDVQTNVHTSGWPSLTSFWPWTAKPTELPHTWVHQAAPSRSHIFWPHGTPGTAHTHPDENWSAKVIQHAVYTKPMFSRLGEIAILSNSQEPTQKVKQNVETEEYSPNKEERNPGEKP